MDSKIDIIKYVPSGVCARLITIAIKNDIVQGVEFMGGCDGNLKAISILIYGMTIDEVVAKLEGNTCGPKPTSCTDQLAKALIEYKSKKLVVQN